MKFKPKTAASAASSQTVSTPRAGVGAGAGARKYAVPAIPRSAGLGGGKPTRPSTRLDESPERTTDGVSPTSPTTSTRRAARQPSASPAPSANEATSGADSASAQAISLTPGRPRATPTPSPAPRSASRAGSYSRRSTTPSARVGSTGKLALLAAAENANVPLHIPASMDRKKRKLNAAAAAANAANVASGEGIEQGEAGGGDEAQKRARVGSGIRVGTAATDSQIGVAGTGSTAANGQSSVGRPTRQSSATAPASATLPPHISAAVGAMGSTGGMPPTIQSSSFMPPTLASSRPAPAPPASSVPPREHTAEDIEALARSAVAELFAVPSASSPMLTAPPAAVTQQAQSAQEEEIPAHLMMAGKRKTKGMDMKISRKRKAVPRVEETEAASRDTEGAEEPGAKRARTNVGAAASGKGRGKIAVSAEGEVEEDEGEDAAEYVDMAEADGEDVDMNGEGEGGEGGDSTGAGATRKSMSAHKALKRQRREPMFPKPNLVEAQPGDMIGTYVDEDSMTMLDLATTRSAEGRISRKSQKWQDKATELSKNRRAHLDDRTLEFWAARRPMRRFIRRQMNNMRARRRQEVAQRGGDEAEEVSADEEDSEFELDEEQTRARRMSPERTPDPDGFRRVENQAEDEDEDENENGLDGERHEGEGVGAEEEGEGEGAEEEEDDENMESHCVNGKWFRVPRGDTPEGQPSYTWRRMGHIPPNASAAAGNSSSRNNDRDRDRSGIDIAHFQGDDFVQQAAADLHERMEGQANYADEDDPNRVVVDVESTNAFVNSASWSKKMGTGERWDKDQTDAFYFYLTIFGENYSQMESFFPERTHKQIKNKARREQRLNLAKYEAFLGAKALANPEEMSQITAWQSSSRTREATKLLAETLRAPAQLAAQDAELRRKRKRRGGRRQQADGEEDQAGLAAVPEEHGEAGGEDGLERMPEDEEGKDDEGVAENMEGEEAGEEEGKEGDYEEYGEGEEDEEVEGQGGEEYNDGEEPLFAAYEEEDQDQDQEWWR